MTGLLDMLQTAWPVLLLGILAALWVTLANKSHRNDKKHGARDRKD